MPVVHLSSDDPRLDDYRAVPDADLLERRGLFVAEGRLVVTRLLAGRRLPVRSVLVTETARLALASALDAWPELPVYVVPQAVMNATTGYNIHRGCLAVGIRPPDGRWQDALSASRSLVVLERVANADNVGAAFRNAAAFGVDGVLLDDESTDPLYRKAIRTSMAASLRLPFARAADLPGALGELRAAGWMLLALAPGADEPLDSCVTGIHPSDRVAVVLGHEGEGLTPATLRACHLRARIPMAPGVDSLNIATAGAIALYEIRRRREP